MELNSLPIPPRCALLRPEPKGFGTGQVQSLSSYLCDVAELHSLQIGQLLWHFSPGARRSSLGFHKSIANWHTREAYLVEVFGALTKRDDLHFLTHLPWEQIISYNGLRSLHTRWCPLCLRHDPYGRLLWTYQEVEDCPIHGIRLKSACDKCGVVTHRRALRPAWLYCECGHDHRHYQDTRPADPETLWKATQISDLLAKGFEQPEIKITRLQEVLRDVLLPMFDTSEHLLRHTGLPYSSFYGHCGQNLRMTIPGLLGTARSVGLTLVDLLTARIEDLRPQVGQPAMTVRPRRILSKKKLLVLVKAALTAMPDERRSLAAVARKVGVSTTRIKNQLPEIANELIDDRRRRLQATIARNDAEILEKMVSILEKEPQKSSRALAHQCGYSLYPRTKKLVAKARELAEMTSYQEAA